MIPYGIMNLETESHQGMEDDIQRKWKQFETKIQEKMRVNIDQDTKRPYHFFSFATKDEIAKYQTEKLGFTFPCSTTDVLNVDMLFGKRFSTQKEAQVLSIVQTKNTIINCDVLDLNVTSLSGKSNLNDPILLQVQTRGTGKTKAIYDLGMIQDVIYFDFSCDSYGSGSAYCYIATCFQSIYQLVEKPHNSYEDFIKLRKETFLLLEKVLISGLIHHGIFRKTFPDLSSEFFFRYAMNCGSWIIYDIFREIQEYDMESIREVAHNYQNDRIIAYDGVGSLTSCFDGKFLCKNVKEGDKFTNQSFRGLFDVFAECIFSMRDWHSHQIVNLTNLSVVNMFSLSNPQFKKSDIAMVTPITPFAEEDICEIIHSYLPGLKIDQRIANRWAGRGHLIMNYFLKNLFQRAIFEKTNNFQEMVDSHEQRWNGSAQSLIKSYIESYVDLEMKSGRYQHEKEVRVILENIYRDGMMGKEKTHSVSSETATNLVRRGFMFLPSTFTVIDFEIQMFQEMITFDSLGWYFQRKREQESNQLEDIGIKQDDLTE